MPSEEAYTRKYGCVAESRSASTVSTDPGGRDGKIERTRMKVTVSSGSGRVARSP